MTDAGVQPLRLALIVGNDEQAVSLRQTLWSGRVHVLPTHDPRDVWVERPAAAAHVSIPLSERWGSKPLVHKAQLLEVGGTHETGLPRYVIAGAALRPGEQLPREDVVRLAVSELCRVVDVHNRRHDAPKIREVVSHARTLGGVGDDLRWFGAALEEVLAGPRSKG